MNGIDISGWQSDIDVAKVPCDFVIVKATQGTSITSNSFTKQINAANAAGKLLGVYHYIDGSGAAAEMKHFYNVIKDWVGKAIICLDWEEYQNSQFNNAPYLGDCIKEIQALTGKTIVLYTGMYYYGALEQGDKYGCKRWIAKYASNNTVNGYQSTPWDEAETPCWIRQYTGAGRLSGYSGNLDLNKAYCTAEEWAKIAGGGASSVPSTPSTSKPSAGYNIYLQSRTATKTLPKVANGEDNAGTNAPMTYLSAWTEPGTLKVQARTEKGGWLPALTNPNNIANTNTGSVGDGSPMTGIRMYYNSPNGDKAVHYRVKTEKNGWLPWMIDHKDTGGSKDDFAGDGSRIQRVEAYIGGLS